ncbi:MAG: hypothetical protein JHC12_02985 [Thermogladius sp.]|nr:hypothetical protein [Thermogladius sp.]
MRSSGLAKLIVYLTPGFEEYSVRVYHYDEEGRLVESREFQGVKSIVIKAGLVSISRQLAREPVTLVVDVDKPEITLADGILRIKGGNI